MPPTRLIVCDDEPDLRDSLIEFLIDRGYQVRGAANGEALAHLIAAQKPDLVVLDVRMPKVDGLTALKAIRADGALPVIMLTAADEVLDRVLGLEFGADDYVGKPVDPRELEARIRTVLRRSGEGGRDGPRGGTVAFDGLTLDLDAASLVGREGEAIALTAMEFTLLRVFVESRGRVLTRDQLLERAHGRAWDPFDRSIDLRISRLRRKIEVQPDRPAIIRTVRGLGYAFDPDGTID